MNGDSCKVKYRRHTDEVVSVKLAPKDSVFKLEEQHGTLAYNIFKHNRLEFGRFYNLFHRKEDVTIEVPQWFFDFDLELDPRTALPSRFVLYVEGEKAADYEFEKTTIID
jgi:hypothetical protein